MLKEKEQRENMGVNLDPFLLRQSGQHLYNTSPLNIKKAWAIEMTLPRTCNDTFGHFRRHYVTSLNALIFTPKPTDAVTKGYRQADRRGGQMNEYPASESNNLLEQISELSPSVSQADRQGREAED